MKVENVLFVRERYHYVKITISDIGFIRSDGNYLEIHSGDKKNVIKGSLKKIKSKLGDFPFFQAHRSYIVNVNKIEKIGGDFILVDNLKIPLNKEKKDELLLFLNTL